MKQRGGAVLAGEDGHDLPRGDAGLPMQPAAGVKMEGVSRLPREAFDAVGLL